MLNRYREIFASLERNQVKYLIIGGIAAVYHGVPRATFDLDILIEATPENASCLLKALEEAQMGTAALISPEELLRHEIVVFEDLIRSKRASGRPRDLADVRILEEA